MKFCIRPPQLASSVVFTPFQSATTTTTGNAPPVFDLYYLQRHHNPNPDFAPSLVYSYILDNQFSSDHLLSSTPHRPRIPSSAPPRSLRPLTSVLSSFLVLNHPSPKSSYPNRSRTPRPRSLQPFHRIIACHCASLLPTQFPVRSEPEPLVHRAGSAIPSPNSFQSDRPDG